MFSITIPQIMTCYILLDLVSPGDGLWPKVAANALVGHQPESKKVLRLAVKNLPCCCSLAEFCHYMKNSILAFFFSFSKFKKISSLAFFTRLRGSCCLPHFCKVNKNRFQNISLFTLISVPGETGRHSSSIDIKMIPMSRRTSWWRSPPRTYTTDVTGVFMNPPFGSSRQADMAWLV